MGDKKALVIADRAVADLVGPILFGSLKEAGLVVTPIMFGGECSTQEINRIASIGKETAADVVIGLGGGKTLDTAKAAGFYLEKNWVSVPTVASSDAPTSALAVIYTADGTFEKYLVLPKNPDLVVMDTGVIAQAPARFLSAGIGDGLSTWVECRANLASRKPALSGGIATKTAVQALLGHPVHRWCRGRAGGGAQGGYASSGIGGGSRHAAERTGL